LEEPATWHQVAGSPEAISTDYAHHAGVYRTGDKLLAVNRSAAEDRAAVLADDRVAELFRGLDFTRVDDRAGSLVGLIQEVWRPFLLVMMISMLVEAGLCLPRRVGELRGAGSSESRAFGDATERPAPKAPDWSRAKVGTAP
jgi:hypothetical protein